jgi:hypothetical protein
LGGYAKFFSGYKLVISHQSATLKDSTTFDQKSQRTQPQILAHFHFLQPRQANALKNVKEPKLTSAQRRKKNFYK